MKSSFKFFLFIAFFVVVVVSIALSPIFTVSTVEVFGNKAFTKEQVLTLSEMKDNANIFALSKGALSKNILSNNYIDDVEISKDYFQKKVTINIKERMLSGYIKHDSGSYIYIDDNGRVLEIKQFFTEKLPIIVGLKISEATYGQHLKLENNVSFDSLVALVQLFKKYEINQDILNVDLGDEADIHIYINDIDVLMGDMQDADEKIRTIKVIVEKLQEEGINGGFLDIRDIDKVPWLKLLT